MFYNTNFAYLFQSSSSSGSESDEWVEQTSSKDTVAHEREDWMSMTGMLKTYTKDDIKPKREEKNKNHIDSYNPATSSRELNPYWKDGGTGVPQTVESFRKSRQFIRPSQDDDDYYSKPSKSYDTSYKSSYYDTNKSRRQDFDSDRRDGDSDKRDCDSDRRDRNSERRDPNSDRRDHTSDRRDSNSDKRDSDSHRSYNWKNQKESDPKSSNVVCSKNFTNDKEWKVENNPISSPAKTIVKEKQKSLYMSDEKLNKLAAKVVKAEIMGDSNLVAELKAKLEAAREYRKQNPEDKGEDDDDEGIMLISTSASGSSRPLVNTAKGDAKSKGGKRKAETHTSGERTKYFGNDDKYNLAQMVSNTVYSSDILIFASR